jgi:hypothetical protein
MPGGGGRPPQWALHHPLRWAAYMGAMSFLVLVLLAMHKGNFAVSSILGDVILAGIFGLFFGVGALLWRRFSPPS